jgi:hypothetical protein
MISAALLLTVIASPQSQSLLLGAEPVFVEVTSGRGSLLAGEATKSLATYDGEQWVDGRGHLSLVANSKAELRWHGRASVVLYGPCDFEWLPATPEEPLKWSFKELCQASIEIRQDEVELKLGDNWTARIPAGALELKGLPGSGYEIMQQAGGIATYQWFSTSSLARPERRGVIGAKMRLKELPSPSNEDLSVRLDGRTAWSWPWRTESEDSSTWQRSDWPWIADRPSPTKVLIKAERRAPIEAPTLPIEITAETQAAESEAIASVEAIEPQALIIVESPEEEVSPIIEEHLDPALNGGNGSWGLQEDAETDDAWRGTAQNEYERFGEYYVQKGVGIDAWQLPDGSVRFSISEDSHEGGWVLGPRLDARINPGGSIEYRPDQALKNHSGAVRVLAAIER